MSEQEDFQMYAINVDAPYIIDEEDTAVFLEENTKQKKNSDIGNLFGEKDFLFQVDEDGNLAVTIHGNQCD